MLLFISRYSSILRLERGLQVTQRRDLRLRRLTLLMMVIAGVLTTWCTPLSAHAQEPSLASCLEDACKAVAKAETATLSGFLDALEGCYGELTPEEVSAAIDYYLSVCLPGIGPAPSPIDRCTGIIDWLTNSTVGSGYSCARKNAILKWHKCPYRFKCDDKDVPPPEPEPCGECPDHGIEPPPFPSPQPPGFPNWGVLDNPRGQPLDRAPKMAGVDLSNGAIERTYVDLALPSAGFPWVIGRSYGARQLDSTGAHRDVNNYQGWNWMQISQPRLYYYSPSSLGGSIGRVTIYLDGQTSLSFVETGAGTWVFKPRGDAAGVVYYDATDAGLWIYHDNKGNTITFVGDGTNPPPPDNRLWKVEDPAGNIAYVGSLTDSWNALTYGYDGNGHIILAFDTSGRQYDYTYTGSTVDGVHRLLSVIVTASSTEVARVEYSYYGYTTDGFNDPLDQLAGAATGLAGDLKLVRVTLPTSAGDSIVRKTHYRYYVDDSTTSVDKKGYKHTLKWIVEPEGVRRYELTVGPITATTAYDATISSYSAEYMEYFQPTASGFNPARYVQKKFNNGECGCGGSTGNGLYEFDYSWQTGIDEWNIGLTPAYHASPAFRAQVTQPDGMILNQYTDVQGLSTGSIIVANVSSTDYYWLSKVERDLGTGDSSAIWSPAGVDASSGFSLSTGTMTTNSTGLVQHFTYDADPALEGFLSSTKISDGTGDQTLVSTTEYFVQTTTLTFNSVSVPIRRVLPQHVWAYDEAQTTAAESGTPTVPSGARRTTVDYTFWSGMLTDTQSLVFKSIITTLPKVAAADNGRGADGADPAVSSATYLRLDGTLAFSREIAYGDRTDAVYTYTLFDGGLPVLRKVDLDDSDGDIDGADDPTGVFGIADMPSSSSGLLTQKALYEYDAQGRPRSTNLYAQLSGSGGNRVTLIYYTKLADGRSVILSIPKYINGGTPIYYGPVGYSVSNHAGRSEFSGTIGFGSSVPFTTTTAINTWINTGSANPITAVFGSGLSLSQGSATLYDNAGAKTTAQRIYTNLSTPSYDESTFAYDDMGRVIRSVDPTGTINRTLYDALGRMIAHSVGTDDTGLPGSPLSGTSNMFTTDQTTYDGAAISAIAGGGNSHATTRKLHPTASSGDDRTTTYIHDFRGRTIVITNPVPPHSVSAYDNRRMVARGTYGDTTGFDATTDPRTTTTDRLSLSESFFDARGQSWKQIQWEIDQSDGAKTSGGTRFLESRSVFGPAGEVLQSRGSDAHRYNYDRLRRRTHDWTLAYTSAWDTDHEVYDDIFDASINATLLSSDSSTGDVVLEEGRTVYDPDRNLVWVTAMVSRHHDDETTHFTSTTTTRGPLDGTSGSSPTFDVSAISGRLNGITAMYYDALDRPSVTAVYGDARTTLGWADYTYDPTAPTSSAVATSSDPAVLVSSRDYDKFGRAERVHDPKDLKTEYTYDDAGRMVKTRANAVGSPGQDTVDTHFTYANGLRTEMWVDKNLNGTYSATTPDFDQKTVYAYASNLSPGGGNPASLVTVNNMLTSVTYPDGGIVKYGYNSLGQQRQTKDQAGNFFDTTYDLGGRETLRVVTTVVSPFDTSLRAVKTVYGDPRGMATEIAQYSDTSATTLLDSVQFAYDHAGNLAERTQTIDGHSWTTSFSHELHVPDGTSNLRSTYVLSELTYPDTTAVGYSYVDSGSWDRAAERVSTVWVDRADDGVGAATLAAYWYNGTAALMEHRAYFSSGSFAERSLAHSLDDLDPSNYRTYPNLDTFGRMMHSWLRRINVTTTPTTSYATFYKVSMLTSASTVGYDFNSNIVGLKDDRWNRYSADFTVDGLNRLIQRTKFVYVGMNENWSMDRLGNFIGVCEGGSPVPGLVTDFNGDGTIAGPDTSECRTSNTSNQITTRSGTPGSLTPVYDIVGNLTDDGTGTTSSTLYTYTWDALGRLTEVWNKASTPLQIAEFRYSADNHRIAWKYPQGDNTWYYPVYDHRWRMIALYKDAGEDPPNLQERFYYHNAGVAGSGGSQYIDSVIARDDTRTNTADPEEDPVYQLTRTMYYAQNWRGDVVGLLNVDGSSFEHVRYTSYGRPVAITAANVSGNGTSSIDDIFLYQNLWSGNNPYADFNMDGIISIDDFFLHQNAWFTRSSGGVDALASGSGNRKGYAGYEHDPNIYNLQLARRRYYRADFASWTQPDPIGYADGMNLYAYVANRSLRAVDPSGLLTSYCRSESGSCGGGAIANDTPTQPVSPSIKPAEPDLPPSSPPATAPTKSSCDVACEKTTAFGTVACDDNGNVIACACENNIKKRFPNSPWFQRHYAECIRAQENTNALMYNCQKQGDGTYKLVEKNGLTPKDLWCNEVDGYKAELKCLEIKNIPALEPGLDLDISKPVPDPTFVPVSPTEMEWYDHYKCRQQKEAECLRDLYIQICKDVTDDPRKGAGPTNIKARQAKCATDAIKACPEPKKK